MCFISRCPILACFAGFCLLITPLKPTFAQLTDPQKSSITFLEQRVREQPANASYWRMLGRAYGRAGDTGKAIEALQRALALDPQSAAAHCDLGISLMESSISTLYDQAVDHFQRAIELAPQSEYASIAAEKMRQIGAATEFEIATASFEIDRFERSDRFPDLSIDPSIVEPLDEVRAFSARIETGGLFNTNVTLTPTSRGLAPGEASSFQGILNTDLEYRLLNNVSWRLGPSLDTYFNVNEGPFQDLNLQSYEPGFFAERSIYRETTILVPRIHYTYTLDEFAGSTFANRHALNTTLSSLWDSGETTTAYWIIDYTNFANDGSAPSISSRDGWTNTIGAHQIWPLESPWLTSFLLGSELQLADTVGSDFAYRGVSVYSESEILINETISMTIEGGWGYRDYYRFEFTPPRNENIWSAGLRLRKMLNEWWSVVGVFRFDDFDSQNAEFASQRIVTGVVTVLEY